MLVLGITFSKAAHDTAAALVKDGRIIAAVEQERLSRKKHDGAFPIDAIAFCLSLAGIRLQDVDVVALGDRPYGRGADSEICQLPTWYVERLIRSGTLRRRTLIHRAAIRALATVGVRPNFGLTTEAHVGLQLLRSQHGPLPRVSYHGHHESHAAAAFSSSGWDEAAVVTVDGRGHFDASAIWHATRHGIRRVWSQPFPNSLGLYYLYATQRLGLGEFAEGKAMGLASYGDPARFAAHFARILETVDGEDLYRFNGFDTIADVVPARPHDQSALTDPYPDFAAATQERLELVLERMVKYAIRITGCKRVCLAGGVALNCSANGILRAKGIADELWVFPACGDNGLAIGAAFLGNRSLTGQERLEHAYFGPSADSGEIARALEGITDCDVRRSDDVAGEVASALASGAVIGWFQGRTEFGPRALGNRSILADPRTIEMRDRVNHIKLRELWRPLAPVVVAESSSEFFELHGESPFMLFAAQVLPPQRQRVPGIVHVDGTARPQTVRRDQNPMLHDLLMQFRHLTGIPMLINTSFNVGREPIVCSATDAVRTFLRSELDVLVLENSIVRKRGRTAAMRSSRVAAVAQP